MDFILTLQRKKLISNMTEENVNPNNNYFSPCKCEEKKKKWVQIRM